MEVRGDVAWPNIAMVCPKIGLWTVTRLSVNEVCHSKIAQQNIATLGCRIRRRHIEKNIFELDIAVNNVDIFMKIPYRAGELVGISLGQMGRKTTLAFSVLLSSGSNNAVK